MRCIVMVWFDGYRTIELMRILCQLKCMSFHATTNRNQLHDVFPNQRLGFRYVPICQLVFDENT